MSELKPCPFCGGMAHIEYNAKGVAIYCGVCGARLFGRTEKHVVEAMFYRTEKLAVEAWNRMAGENK